MPEFSSRQTGTIRTTNGFYFVTNESGISVGTLFDTAGVGTHFGENVSTYGRVYFSNANGMSFGANGAGVITASFTGGSGGGGLYVSASGSTNNVSGVSFSNANGISFFLTGSTIYASHNALTSQTSLVFSNSNNVSFGISGSTLTASASFSQSVDTGKAGTGFTAAGTNIGISGTHNTNGLSLLLSVADQTIDTRKAGTGITLAGTNITFSGTNNTNGLSLQASVNAQSVQPGIQSIVVSDQTFTTGQVSFKNLNGISFGSNGAGVITASYTVPTQSNQNVSLFALGNTTQNSSTVLNASNLSFNGLGNVTVGFSNGSIQVSATQTVDTNKAGTGFTSAGNNIGLSGTLNTNGLSLSATVAAQSNQNISLFALGNTTQNSSTLLNASNLSFNGLGNITVGYSNGSIQISNSQSVDTNKAGTGFTSAGTNISFSGTLNTNGLSLQASVAAQSAQPAIQSIVVSDATFTNGQVSFKNLNGISFGSNGAGVISASYTVPTQSNQNISLYALGNTTQNSSTVLNASNLSFNGAGIITVGYSNGSIQISATGVQTADTNKAGTGFTSAGSNIGLSGTLNTNGLSLSVTVFDPIIKAFASGNTFATNATSSALSLASIILNARGNLSVGVSNNSINLSVPDFPSQTVQPGIQSIAVSDQTFTTGQVSLKNANGISFGSSGAGIITASYTVPTQSVDTNKAGTGFTSAGANVGISGTLNTNGLSLNITTPASSNYRLSNDAIGLNTAQTNVTWTVNSSGLSLNAGGYAGTGFTSAGTNISVSGTLATNGLSLSLSGPAPGLANLVMYDNMGLGVNSSGLSNDVISYNQLQIFPLSPHNIIFPGNMTMNTFGVNMTMSDVTSVMSRAMTTSVQFGLYTVVTTGGSLSLGLINSVQGTFGHAAAATNNSTGWAGARWWTFASSQWSSQPVLSGNVVYVMGMLLKSSGSSLASASIYGQYLLQTQARSGAFGVSQPAAATWQGLGMFNGIYSNTTVSAMPANINYTEINKQSTGGNFIPHIQANNLSNLSAL
jgi:hypothetical protein